MKEQQTGLVGEEDVSDPIHRLEPRETQGRQEHGPDDSRSSLPRREGREADAQERKEVDSLERRGPFPDPGDRREGAGADSDQARTQDSQERQDRDAVPQSQPPTDRAGSLEGQIPLRGGWYDDRPTILGGVGERVWLETPGVAEGPASNRRSARRPSMVVRCSRIRAPVEVPRGQRQDPPADRTLSA